MKKSILTLAFIALATGFIFTACTSSAEKVDDSKEKMEQAERDLEDAKMEYELEYNKFKLEEEAKITANEQLIADLKVHSKNKKNEVKADYDKAVNDLEAKNQAMKERIAAQREANKENWESFVKEFNHDMEEIGSSIKNLGKDNVK